MKQRLEATHFIEVFKRKEDGLIINYDVDFIEMLSESLKESFLIGHKTIAVWKIKYK